MDTTKPDLRTVAIFTLLRRRQALPLFFEEAKHRTIVFTGWRKSAMNKCQVLVEYFNGLRLE
jgi:hypothetical protein